MLSTIPHTVLLLLFATGTLCAVTSPLPDGTDVLGYPAFGEVPPINTTWTSYFLSDVTVTGAPRETALPPVYSENVITECQSQLQWALTYDDGPGMVEDVILDDLKSKNLLATFFALGSSAMRFSTSFNKMYSSGHEIAMHTWSHAYLTNLTNDQIVAEIVWTAKVMYQLTGKVPRFFRPPYADIDVRVETIINAMDLTIITWNCDSNDYSVRVNNTELTRQAVLNNINTCISNANPKGVISLEHDRFNETAVMAPTISTMVVNANFKPITMSECIGNTTEKGMPYFTSGKLYKLVTGHDSESVNPNVNNSNTNNGSQPGSSAETIVSSAHSTVLLSAAISLFFALFIL